MMDFKCNFEMTTQSQSQSSILNSLPPADSVTKIPKSNDDVSKNQSSKIHTSSEDDLDYFVAFTRRYGKTYSPYGNIGPVVKKFGKTYSSRGNIKNANVDSKPSTESKPKKHDKPVSVKNSSVSKKLNIKDSSTLEHHLKGKDVRDLSAQNERLPFPETLSQVNKKNKVPLKYSPQSGSEKHVISQSKSLSEESANLTINLKSHSSEENDFYSSKKAIITDSAKSKGHFKKSNDLVPEKIKFSDDKSNRVIFLKKSFLGQPVMTFHLLPSSNTLTISPVRHTSGNEGSNSTGDKTLLKHQQVLADKNSVSDSETLVDQIAPGSFGIVNKSHSSHIKNIFPVSASRKDTDSTPAKLSADSAKKTFVCRHKKNLTLESTATSIKTQPLSESSFVDTSGAETDKNGMSASEAKEFKQFDPRSQMNTYVRSKNLDSTSILPVSVNSEALQVDIVSRSNADALKSPQNVLIVPKSTKDIPTKKTKGKSLPAEEISIADISVNKMKSLKPKKKLKRLKETSKVSSSDSKSNKLPKKLSKTKKKILKVQSDCCFSVSENSTISGISNDLKLTSKIDNSEKFNPSSQLLTEKMIDGALEEDMKKTKLKPVPTELALVSVDCPSSLINADKTGKKFVKKKKRMLSNKEKLLKKMKLLKSEKLKIMSPKKKVKLSNLFLNDAGKVCEKTIKSQFLPTLEKFEPVLKEHHLRVEGSTDDMPVLEDATKATPLRGQGQRKMSGLQKRASNSMYISKSTNTELFVSGKDKKIKSKRLSPEMKAGKTSLLTKGKTRNSKSSKMSTGKIAKMTKLSKVSKVSEKVKTSKSSSDAKTRKRKLSELSVDSQKNKVSTDVKKKTFKSSKPRISTEKSKLSESYNEMSDLSELSFVTGASICKSANFSPDKLEMSKLSKLSPVKSMEESQQSECPALFRALELMKKLVDTTDSDIPEVKASVAKSEISDSPELEKLETKTNLASSAMPISSVTESMTGSSLVDVPSNTKEVKFSQSSQQINIQKPSLPSACISSAKLSGTPDSAIKTSVCEHKTNLASSSTPIPIKAKPPSESFFVDTPSSQTDKSKMSSQQINIQKPSLPSACIASAKLSVTPDSAVKTFVSKHKKNLASSSAVIPQINIGKASSSPVCTSATLSVNPNSAVNKFVCRRKKNLALSSTPIPIKAKTPSESSFVDTPSSQTDKSKMSSQQINIQKPSLPSACISSAKLSVTPDSAVKTSVCDHKKNLASSSTSIPIKAEPLSESSFVDTLSSQTDKSNIQKSFSLADVSSATISVTSKSIVKKSDCHHKKNLASSSTPIPSITEQILESSLADTQSNKIDRNTLSSPKINIQKPLSQVSVSDTTISVTSKSIVKNSDCKHNKNLALASTPISSKTKQILESSLSDTQSNNADRNTLSSPQNDIQKPLSQVSISYTTTSATENSVFDNFVKPGLLVSGSSKKLNEHSKLLSPATTQSIPTSLPNFQSKTLSKTSDKDSLNRSNVLLPPTNVPKPSLPSVCTSVTPIPAVTRSDCQHEIKIVSSYSISTYSYDTINSICKTSSSNKIHPVKTDNLVSGTSKKSEDSVKLLVPATIQSTSISLPNFQSQTFLNNTGKSPLIQPNVLVPQINIGKASSSPVCTSATLSVNPNSAVNKFVCRHKKNLALSSTPIPIKPKPPSESSFVDTPSSQTDKSKMSSQQINIQKPSLPSACISSAKLSVTPDSAVKTSVCDHKKNLASSSTSIPIKAEPLSESSFVDTLSSQTDKSKMSSQQINIQKPSLPSACISSAKLSVTPDSAVKTSVCDHKKNLASSSTSIPIKAEPLSESSFVDTLSSQTDKSKMSSQQINIQKPSLPSACISSAKLSVTPDSAVKTSVCDHKKNLASSSTSIPIKAEPLSESSFVDTLSSQTDKSKMSSQQINIQKPSLPSACISSAKLSVTPDSAVKTSVCDHKKNLASSSTSIPIKAEPLSESSFVDTLSSQTDKSKMSSQQINIQKPSLPSACISSAKLSVTPDSAVKTSVCDHKKNLASSSTSIPIKAEPLSESSFVDTLSSQRDKSKMSSQQINIQKPSLPSACISSAKLSVTPDSAVKTSVCDHKKNLASSSTSIPIKAEPLSESSFVDTLSSQTDKSKMSSQQINIQKPSLPSACISSAKLSVTPDSAVKTFVSKHKKNLASSSAVIPQINIGKASSSPVCTSATLSVNPNSAVNKFVCRHKKNLALSSTPIPIKAKTPSESSFVDTPSSQTDKSKMSSQQINIQKPSLPSACISSAKLSVTPDSAVKTSVCDHKKNLASSSTSIPIKAEPLSESSFVDTLSSQTDKSKMSSQQINIQKPSLPSACISSAKLSVTPDSAVKTFVSKHKKNLASSSAVIPQINIGKASSSPVCTSATLSVNPNSAVNKFVCRHKKNLALSSTPIPIKAKTPSESSFVDTPSSQTDKSKMSSQQINIQKPSLPSACISSAKLSVTPDSAVKTSVCDHKKNLASSSTSIPIKAEPLSESLFVDTLSSQTDKSKMSSQQINIQKSFSLADVSSATISVTSKSIVKKSDCHHKKNLASSSTPITSITEQILESSLADTQSNKIDRNTLSSLKINIQKPFSQVSVSDTTTSVTAKSGFDNLVKPDMLASKPKKLNEHTKLWLPVSTQSIPTSSSNLNNSGKTPQPVVDQAIPLSAAKTNVDPLGSTNAINANSVCLQGLENATVSTNNVGMELTSPSSHDIKMSNRVSIVPCLAKPVTKVTLLPKRENIVKHEMATCDVLPRTHSVEGMKLCSKSSVKKQESTVMPSTDNVPPKSTSPANCTSSLGPTPPMGLQTNDSATPSKPPSVSVSAVAMPSSAKMSDTSSSRHLSPPEPKLKSNQRRLWKKPFKMNKNKLAYLAYKKHLFCGRQKMSTSVHMLCSDCNYPFTHRHKLGIHLKLRKDLHKTCFVHRWMHKGKILQHKGAAKKRNNQSANKVTSIDNDNIKDPNSTTVPKSSEDNKKFVKLTDCKSTNLLRINSKKLTPKKAHCSKKVRKSLKAKQNVSHGFKDFQALDSSESLQGNSDNSSKPNFVKTQPATEIISGRQELGISNLSPPMLSPQNASPTSATYGDESLGSPLQIEDPPFLSKVQYPNENLKIFSSGFLKLQADLIINKLIKEDQADSVPSSCPEISTAVSTVDSADVQKEKDILVEDVKKSENLEKNDDLSSETFHQQERIIFLSNNDDPNFSGNSKSMPRVGSPRTIVQCSMKDESDDTNLSKESSRNPSETLSTKDSKATCREVLFEDTTTKEIAKTSAREKNSGISKSPNSLESLPQLPNIATDEQCSDSNKDLAIKSNLVSEKPKPDSELYLKPVRCVPKRNYKKPQKYFCVDFDTSGWTGGKTSNLSPVVTSTNTSSLTNTSPAKSRAVTCEPSKDISNRTKENFNEKNKTNCTNNKINNNNNNINTITTNKCNRNAKDNNDKVNTTTTTTTTTIKNKSNDIDNKNHSNANNNNELEESEKNVQRSRSQYNSKNKKIMEETTVEARNWNKELQKKKLLRLRFKDFIPRLYDNSKLAKKVADEEQTDSPQTSVENSSEPHESVTRMTTSSPHAQKPLLSAIKSEWDVIPMPTKTWREELVDNLINYTSANSDGIEKVSGNSCQIKSEECNVRTEPIQLSKLLGNPQTVVSSPAVTTTTTTAASYPALRFPLIPANTVRRIATFLPVTNMDATNNIAVPVTIFGNTMPVFTNLGNNQVFIGNLPAPLPMPIVHDQKQGFPQILTTLPEPKTANEETTNFCPELKIKKEVVTNDDEYGGRQSDNAFGLRITGVAGNVTTHNTIPPLPDAIYSNAGSVDGHNADQRPKKQLLIRRRSLQCTLLQTVDSFGVSEFLFECCGSSFSTSLELASHIDLCHS